MYISITFIMWEQSYFEILVALAGFVYISFW